MVYSESTTTRSSLHSAEKDVGPDVHCFVRLTFAAHNRLYLGSARNTCNLNPSLIVLLHPAAIHMVSIAGKCNNNEIKQIETFKLTTWTVCTLHMWLLYALQAKSASIDVTRGEGGVSPRNNFIYFVNISTVTNNTKKTNVLLFISIYSYV